MEKKNKIFQNIGRFIKESKAGRFAVIAVLLGVFVFFGITIASESADISRLEQEKADLNTKYTAQIEDNKELQAVLDNDDKDAYIEQKAREKGYVKSDEIVFYDISGSGK